MSASDTVGRYGAAASTGDMTGLAATLSPDVVWHQPGANPLSGDHVGPEAVVAHLGRFMELSGGTFALSTESVTDAGALVATTVRFTASRPGHPDLDQRGVDGLQGFLTADAEGLDDEGIDHHVSQGQDGQYFGDAWGFFDLQELGTVFLGHEYLFL